MRQIVLDTETTGLNPNTGDRIIEIGCVELFNRRLTGANLHFYLNPERDIDAGAIAVHGLTREFLSDKPRFAEIAEDFLSFVQGAELIIHNATFDMGFLDAEFKRLNTQLWRRHIQGVIDTLLEARQMFPGKRNSLDALCDRLGISNAHRTLHGALLDAELLAEVYLAMTRGQNALVIESTPKETIKQAKEEVRLNLSHIHLPVMPANQDELNAHESVLDGLDKALKKPCIWRAAS